MFNSANRIGCNFKQGLFRIWTFVTSDTVRSDQTEESPEGSYIDVAWSMLIFRNDVHNFPSLGSIPSVCNNCCIQTVYYPTMENLNQCNRMLKFNMTYIMFGTASEFYVQKRTNGLNNLVIY
jgi:hypothetical protein